MLYGSSNGVITNIENCYNYGNINITGTKRKSDIGGIVGYFAGKTITSCINEGEISLTGAHNTANNSGGIVGFNSGLIKNCENKARIEAKNTVSDYTNGTCYSNAGGIVGYNIKMVQDSTNIGEIYSLAGNGCAQAGSGGIVGMNRSEDAIIDNCTNEGYVKIEGYGQYPEGHAGGICGYNRFGKINLTKNLGDVEGYIIGGICGGTGHGGVIISNSYNAGHINGKRIASGILGEQERVYTSEENKHYAKIYNCYNMGELSGTSYGITMMDNAGTNIIILENCYNIANATYGICKIGNSDLTLKNLYYLDTSSNKGMESEDIFPKTEEFMKSQAFVDLLNENVTTNNTGNHEELWNYWAMDTENVNNGYPIFRESKN